MIRTGRSKGRGVRTWRSQGAAWLACQDLEFPKKPHRNVHPITPHIRGKKEDMIKNFLYDTFTEESIVSLVPRAVGVRGA